jgi:hypothetical protein
MMGREEQGAYKGIMQGTCEDMETLKEIKL